MCVFSHVPQKTAEMLRKRSFRRERSGYSSPGLSGLCDARMTETCEGHVQRSLHVFARFVRNRRKHRSWRFRAGIYSARYRRRIVGAQGAVMYVDCKTYEGHVKRSFTCFRTFCEKSSKGREIEDFRVFRRFSFAHHSRYA